MKKAEVIKLIGKKNWKKFVTWMSGQTLRINKDGSFNYYSHDVMAFVDKLKSGYDRQRDLMKWD